MNEYHTKYPTSNPLSSPKPAQPHAFMTLASRYGLPNMQIAPSTKEQEDSGKQSVEDEFVSYTAMISYRNADVLRFWKVRSHCQHTASTDVPLSWNISGTPLFSRWQWITCRSKHQLSLASVCSHQALRLIPKNGTVSVLPSWKCYKCSSFG